jgi:two-component system, NarL family, sensor kinase
MNSPEIAQVYLIIGVAVVAMLLMAGSIILFVLYYQKRMTEEQLRRQEMELDYQRKMMEAALESQENERRRVAGDLHDSIGAMLSTIRLSLLTHVKRNPGDTAGIVESKKMLDETIDSVRRISRDLMPSTLEKFGLVQAIKEMCDRFQSTSALPITFNEIGSTPALAKNRELMVFRIVQELINNSLKHAKAKQINVVLNNSHQLLVSVEDDGTGFVLEDQKSDKTHGKGLGLFNIENRARVIGGSVEFNSEIGHGSKIVISIPYEKV